MNSPNPLKVNWPKPATKQYPVIYLGGEKSRRSKLLTNTELARKAAKNEDDPEVPGIKIRSYKPHQRVAVHSGDIIGLSQKNQVYVGKSLVFDAALSTKTTGGETFNKVARRHGLKIGESNFNADHILERQLGGADTLDNLWPLNSTVNSTGGSVLHLMNVELSPGIFAKMTDMKNTSRKYFLKVASTL